MSLNDSINQGIIDFDLLHQILHGDANTSVTTDGGQVPTLAKTVAGINARVVNALTATSATTLTIGTGVKTITIPAGKAFQPGQYVTIADGAGTDLMFGTVVSYADTTLIVNVVNTVGAGAYNTWTVSISGPIGKAGISAYELAVNSGFVGSMSSWLDSLKGAPGTPGINGSNGERGMSAYEVAIQYANFSGTEADWVASLRGPIGPKGIDGANGADGAHGVDGKSAYELAAANGYTGTLQDWLTSIKGKDGTSITIKDTLASEGDLPGTATLGDAYVVGGDIFIYGQSGWFNAGQFLGLTGADGRSAYQIAKDNGFAGTEAEWLTSLRGPAGPKGDPGVAGKSAYDLAVQNGFVGTQVEWLASLRGPKGDTGSGGGGGGSSAAEVLFSDSKVVGPLSLDANVGNVFVITLTADFTVPLINNPVPGQTYLLVLMQDMAGRHVVKIDKKYKFSNNVQPTPSTAGSSIDLIEATYSSTGFFFCTYTNGYTITPIVRIGTTRYDSMQLAANAVQEGDTIYVTRSGQMAECIAYFLNNVNYTIAGDPSISGVPELKVDSTIRLAFGKAILDPEAGSVVIRDIALTGGTSSDKSGTGIRNNPGVNYMRLERVKSYHNENGCITSAASSAALAAAGSGYTMEIIDCEFTDNSWTDPNGQSHNIYLSHDHRVYVLRSKFTNAVYGHDFKSRASLIVLDRVYCSGAGSRELDMPNGGVCHAVNSSFIMPAKTGQNNLIGIAHEGAINTPQEYIFRNCLLQNDSGGNFSETFVQQKYSSVPVKFIDCVFIGPSRCVMDTPFELYYTGGPIGPEGWDQSIRGITPKRGTYGNGVAANTIWPDDQQPVRVDGPDPTLGVFPPTGSTATPTVRPENQGPDTQAPTVALSSSTLVVSNSGNITLTANASDNVGVTLVEYYRGTTKIGSTVASPHTFNVALTDADNGTVTFMAKAYDAMGNVTASNTVTVTVNVLPPPTVYTFSMDSQTQGDYSAAIVAAASGSKRLAGATAISTDMGVSQTMNIFQENVLVLTLRFMGAMVVADDGTDVTVSTVTPEASNPLVPADITAGTWHFELQSDANNARIIKGSVGPEGSGKMVELSDNPTPGVGISTSFALVVPRSVDGLA